MAKKKLCEESNEDKKNRIITKLELVETEKKDSAKKLAKTLLEKIEVGSMTIKELAEFAAYQAVENDFYAAKKIDEFRTERHLINSGLKDLDSLKNPATHLIKLYRNNSTKNVGTKMKSIATDSIKALWQAAIESGEVTKGNKSKARWIDKVLERPEFKELSFSPENLGKELTFK